METKDKLYYLCINEMDFLTSEQKLLLDRYLIKNRYYLYKSREEKQNLKSIFNRANKGETKMVKKFYELEAGKIYKVEHKPSIPLSSFKDVLLFVKENPKTKVKVEHEKLDNVIDELLIEKEKKLLDKPRTLDYLIFKLGQWFKEPSDLVEVFLNGKWYVEK